MLMVIFGAGASHDSVLQLAGRHDLIDRPPLGTGLFDRAYDRFVGEHPASGTLIDELRGLGATANIEAELDRIQTQEAQGSPTRRRELLALRYYLRHLLWEVGDRWERDHAPGQSNYHILLQRLELWRERQHPMPYIVFVSFNYDRMLDKAVRDVYGNPLKDVDDYMRSDGRALFKPHGSVDWIRTVENDSDLTGETTPAEAEATMLKRAADGTLEVGDLFHVVATRDAFSTPDHHFGVPALTVPVLSKDAFELPRLHVNYLSQVIPRVKWVLIIGWRATEKNFLGLWRSAQETHPRLQIVNKTSLSADATLAALHDAGITESEYVPYDNGLSWYLGDRNLLQDFLAK